MATEVDQILDAMQKGNHFLLSGGAGSGKTHTLIELIQRINDENPKSKIACITYTNVAADEITERADSFSLKASTIHDFLWDNIKGFQTNLRNGIIELNESIAEEDLANDIEIQYREFKSLKKGVVSHDEVIQLSKYLFDKHHLLSKIISDKFDYIFVDEYQDTSIDVINILFQNLNLKEFDLKIGFFGDSMQSIYDGIGILETTKLITEKTQRNLVKINKNLNRRNPQAVIDLANKLRNDKLRQEPLKNTVAPNINKDGSVKRGNLTFLYSSSMDRGLEEVLNSKYCASWDFENYDEKGKPLTKILFTKNSSIAKQAKFNSLFEIYTKDKVVGKSGYVKRIKDILKTVEIDYEIETITFLELLNKLTKTIDTELKYPKAVELVKIEKQNFDTTQKAINAVKKVYPGIDKILPARTMCDFIFENEDLFNIALGMLFKDLSNTYLDKEKLIGNKKSKNSDSNSRNDEKDVLIKYLYKIEEIISLYESRNITELIRKIDFKILRGEHKLILKNKMDELCSLTDSKIKNVLDFIESSGLLHMDSKVSDFIKTNDYLITRIDRIDFSEVINLYNYTEGLSSYSTQHGIKGDEFDNVLVNVSGEKTPQLTICYEFLFENKLDEEKYFDRTLNLFYVACTRTKEDLVVFYEGVCSEEIKSTAKSWFGSENVIDLDSLK